MFDERWQLHRNRSACPERQTLTLWEAWAPNMVARSSRGVAALTSTIWMVRHQGKRQGIRHLVEHRRELLRHDPWAHKLTKKKKCMKHAARSDKCRVVALEAIRLESASGSMLANSPSELIQMSWLPND